MNGSAAVMDSVGSGIEGVEEGRIGRTTARGGMKGRGWTGGRAGDGQGEEVEGIGEGSCGTAEGEGEGAEEVDAGQREDFQESKACSPQKNAQDQKPCRRQRSERNLGRTSVASPEPAAKSSTLILVGFSFSL